MRDEHLKEWLAESSKNEREETASDQETLTEETTAGPDGTGREETEDIRDKTPVEAFNSGRVVDIFQTEFGEGRLAE